MDNSAVLSVKAGLHWSFRMSRQMAPFWLLTFGCLSRIRRMRCRGVVTQRGSHMWRWWHSMGRAWTRRIYQWTPHASGFSAVSRERTGGSLSLGLSRGHAPHFGDEAHLGRLERIRRRDVYVHLRMNHATCITADPRSLLDDVVKPSPGRAASARGSQPSA